MRLEDTVPDDAPEEVPDVEQPPAAAPPSRLLRRFAGALSDTYLTMDPDVAQLITAPGVLPRQAETEPDS